MTNSVLVALALAACSSAAPPVTNTVAKDPPKPPAIAVQHAFKGTFMIGPPFSQVPPFTLLDDGTWIAADGEDAKSVVTAKLSRAEVDRIRDHVLELGFARLESHTDSCKKLKGNTSMCVSDASFTILRVAQGGQLREISTYAGFSNEPEIHQKIVEYLEKYPHPKGATPYRPARAVLHVHAATAPAPASCPAIDPEALHRDATRDRWATLIDGKVLEAVLAIAPSNRGKLVACAGADRFELTLVPEVPGADLSEELGVYERK